MIAAYATDHGIAGADGKYVIGVYNQDTNEHLFLFRIEDCTMITQRVRDFVESESNKLDYNVVEWR